MYSAYSPQPDLPATVSIGIKDIGPYYWVGQCLNGIHYYAGQTFKSTATGRLKRIKLFPSIVYGDSKAHLGVYEFDTNNHTWKEKKAGCDATITKQMEGQWASFELPEFNVRQGQTYAFRLNCEGKGMLAIAECPWSQMNPYPDGEEWIGSSLQTEGYFHKDFDLAFEAQIEAS
ncbi:hypothetical protein EXU57_18060 [Segetibacter sp. 3557_3]|uniref:hypothetical protein n=1 Tax=Segetibacter sp. 3557_3 TaxID=2547429 RepID=UPI0010585FC5|nr:hypothetical protein [Segetibacter sp. 3557_3]TDH22972.1 hypothetical protein EXU57_18060 [Segetibacter sp. 3557_3]